jgi:hypothetical protein
MDKLMLFEGFDGSGYSGPLITTLFAEKEAPLDTTSNP